MGSEALESFHPAVREWFRTSFPQPTPAQAQAQPVEEMRKLPLETLLRSLASDFRAFADEWNGAAA